MWPARIEAHIRRAKGHVALVAPAEYGGQSVLSGLKVPSQPVLRVALPQVKDDSSVLYGNLLSDAFEEAFGFRLFGYGMPFHYGIGLMAAQTDLLGRFTVALSFYGDLPASVAGPLLSQDPSKIKTVMSAQSIPYGSVDTDVRVIHAAELAMTDREARALAGDVVEEEHYLQILNATGGAYLSFVSSLNRIVPSPPLANVADPRSIPSDAARHLLSVYVRQSRWLEAMKIAVGLGPQEAIDVFRQGAASLIEHGLHAPLWELLEQVPREALAVDDDTMYLYYTVATAANRHREVSDFIRAYLESNEAADLRARWSVAVPTSRSMAEAKRAYEAKRNINTARALAFLNAMQGDADTAVVLLKESLEIAQASDDRRLTCLLALDVSHALVLAARYSSGRQWAQWGLDRFLTWRIGDELLRMNLINQVGYLDLLIGELGAAENRISTLPISDEHHGIPMMEALLSTRGDLAYVQGDLSAALDFYSKHSDQLTLSNSAIGAVDIAKVLARMRRVTDVEGLLSSIRALAEVGEGHEMDAAALSIVEAHAAIAKSEFRRAAHVCQRALQMTDAGPYLRGQGVLLTACAYAADGQIDAALETLHAEAWSWRELGESGWVLLTSLPDVALRLFSEVSGVGARPQVKVMGTRVMRATSGDQFLSRRNAELLALLLLHPEGYRSEQLVLDLYGDSGRESTLKAQLSRLRRLAPIASRPYRLEYELDADAVRIDTHLANGEIAQALELYQGPLLPESEAPGIVRERERIDEALRQAVLLSGDAELTLRLARKFPDDLELWEQAKELTPEGDPAYPLIRAKVRRIRGEWGL